MFFNKALSYTFGSFEETHFRNVILTYLSFGTTPKVFLCADLKSTRATIYIVTKKKPDAYLAKAINHLPRNCVSSAQLPNTVQQHIN